MKALQQTVAIRGSFFTFWTNCRFKVWDMQIHGAPRELPRGLVRNENTQGKRLLIRTTFIVGFLCEHFPHCCWLKTQYHSGLSFRPSQVCSLAPGVHSRKLPISSSRSLKRLRGSGVLGRKAISCAASRDGVALSYSYLSLYFQLNYWISVEGTTHTHTHTHKSV